MLGLVGFFFSSFDTNMFTPPFAITYICNLHICVELVNCFVRIF